MDVSEGAVVVRVVCCVALVAVCHFGVAVQATFCAGAIVGRAVCMPGTMLGGYGI